MGQEEVLEVYEQLEHGTELTVKEIAELGNFSESSVSRCLRALVKSKEMRRRVQLEKTNGQRPFLYRLNK